MGYRFKTGVFFGALESVEKCLGDREVSIHKVRKGRDAYAGSATTDDSGKFRLERAKADGNYYAVAQESARGSYGHVVLCAAGHSKTLRVKGKAS